jgi:hypothetical protein
LAAIGQYRILIDIIKWEVEVKRTLAVMALVSLAGCGTTVTKALPIGNDTFSVTSRGDTGFAPLSGIKAEAITEAMQYCASQGKDYQPANTREVATGLGVWPQVEVQFKCLDRKK